MLKFELQAILVVVSAVAWAASLMFHNLLSKAREHGLVDKAKNTPRLSAFGKAFLLSLGSSRRFSS